MPRKLATKLKLHRHLTTVTPLSKTVAATMFILIPIISFIFGTWYGENYTKAYLMNWNEKPVSEVVACTEDAMICPDGSSVGRSGPLCEFEQCPESSDAGAGKKVQCMLGPKACPNGEQVWPDDMCSYPSCDRTILDNN